DHYFKMFLSFPDLLASLAKVLLFCAAVTLIHCYYGYFATGGPAGVGAASGRAIRASLVVIVVLNFVMTVAIWGLSPVLIFKG
ncbi:MAG: ABC transporter permease, partial [Nocardia sp.]|nr:ABC transporter permease [Nocardia sp.]